MVELEGHLYRLKGECAELEQTLRALTAQLMPTWSARKAIKAHIDETYDHDQRGLIIPRSGDSHRRTVLIAELDEMNANPKIISLTREHRIVGKTVGIWEREIAKVETAISREVKRAAKEAAMREARG
jgi:hypothetical protein